MQKRASQLDRTVKTLEEAAKRFVEMQLGVNPNSSHHRNAKELLKISCTKTFDDSAPSDDFLDALSDVPEQHRSSLLHAHHASVAKAKAQARASGLPTGLDPMDVDGAEVTSSMEVDVSSNDPTNFDPAHRVPPLLVIPTPENSVKFHLNTEHTHNKEIRTNPNRVKLCNNAKWLGEETPVKLLAHMNQHDGKHKLKTVSPC